MNLPRKWVWLRRGYAFLMGYFWLPCPLCGQNFSGAEMGNGRGIIMGDGAPEVRVACRWCPAMVVWWRGFPSMADRMVPGRVK